MEGPKTDELPAGIYNGFRARRRVDFRAGYEIIIIITT